MPQFLLNLFLVLSYLIIGIQIAKRNRDGEPIKVKDAIVFLYSPFNVLTILTFWLVSRFVSVEDELIR